jgi:hypothetical protein
MTPDPAPIHTRRYDLDWLRTAAVLMLIPYHASRMFDTWEPYYVKNSPTSPSLTILRAILDLWGMPLLFVIAVAAAATFGMHELARRWNVTKALFGIRSQEGGLSKRIQTSPDIG